LHEEGDSNQERGATAPAPEYFPALLGAHLRHESGNLLGDVGAGRWAARAIGSLPPLREAITRKRVAAALNETDGTPFVLVTAPVLAS
jgi:hypothetical protein